MYSKKRQTAESVTEGHPDKVCDQISDAILDKYLEQDPDSRVAIECVGGHGKLFILGEVTTKATTEAEKIARDVYKDIGYKDVLEVESNIVTQSPDIARGVDTGGAGDQGIMYGFATNENDKMLPKALVLAHALTDRLTYLRKNNKNFSWLMPDGKAQVTIVDDKVDTVVISAQHKKGIPTESLRKGIIKSVIKPVVKEPVRVYLINPTGQFVQGGFEADTGLTGRKIMVDTYGGLAPQGGGCFSGKDSTKVDRSAAYMARYLAKQIIKRSGAKQCLVSLAYAIGHVQPVMVEVMTDQKEDNKNREWVLDNFDLSPTGIINLLKLKKPVFRQTSINGHFGNPNFSWER